MTALRSLGKAAIILDTKVDKNDATGRGVLHLPLLELIDMF
jgi:hypothetical protein